MKTARFRGKRYKIVFKPLKEPYRGMCDDPSEPGRQIEIDSRLEDKELLATLIHEGLHACLWDLGEDAIEAVERDLTNFLWRLGYRKLKLRTTGSIAYGGNLGK